eukprot:TRINITY_DN6351_c0_g2_i3.p1 TRINITY_DN6351_c0_g2~~TRINITY_DN6351_c0_g2_i3.p1  ORF type:complete len:195 (+),score=39.26 TRINITY_DN6351_c0_g2_i3:151-735(+)
MSEFVPEVMTPQANQAWFILIGRIGKLMTESYPELMRGLKGSLHKLGQKRAYTCLLTHECLLMYKDEQMTKEVSSIWLKWVSDISVITEEKYLKVSPFCLSLSMTAEVVFYFNVATEDDLKWWVENLAERVAAHQRIADEDSSDESAHIGPDNENQVIRNLKKLRSKLKKKSSDVIANTETQASILTPSSSSKH